MLISNAGPAVTCSILSGKIGLLIPSISTVLVRFFISIDVPVSVSLLRSLNSNKPLVFSDKLLKSISTIEPL